MIREIVMKSNEYGYIRTVISLQAKSNQAKCLVGSHVHLVGMVEVHQGDRSRRTVSYP